MMAPLSAMMVPNKGRLQTGHAYCHDALGRTAADAPRKNKIRAFIANI
jgi:hypothetical protein